MMEWYKVGLSVYIFMYAGRVRYSRAGTRIPVSRIRQNSAQT